MQSRTAKTAHYIALDGVRGLAAVSVLAFHLGRWLDAPWLAINGNLSVDTFFTLSGYALALAYTKRAKHLSMRGFILTRLIRLMPIIMLVVAISAPGANTKTPIWPNINL